MFFKRPSFGDEAYRQRVARRRRIEFFWQALVVVLVIAFVWAVAHNINESLTAHGIRSGFGFLTDRSSFEIGESVIPVTSNDPFYMMFLAGFLNTIKVAAVSVITATLLGLVVAVMRLSQYKVIRFLGTAHVEVYRNIPLLIQLFAIYLVITEFLPDIFEPVKIGNWLLISKSGFFIACPEHFWLVTLFSAAAGLAFGAFACRQSLKNTTYEVAMLRATLAFFTAFAAAWILSACVTGWSMPRPEGFWVEGGLSMTPEFITLWTGLTLFTSASIAEIIRAGILTVGKKQWQAGMALGMKNSQILTNIILPQSLKLVIPPLASQYMNLTKNSSLAVIIGYPDIVSVGNTSIVIMGQALEAIVIIMSVYLLINLLTALLMSYINGRVTRTSVRRVA